MEWNLILAGFINSVLVLMIVQFLKIKIPSLRQKAPQLIPILSGFIGLVIAPVQTWLGNLLGVPIDLSPIAGIFTGATATTIHQVHVQSSKGG